MVEKVASCNFKRRMGSRNACGYKMKMLEVIVVQQI